MPKSDVASPDLEDFTARYQRDGFCFPLQAMSRAQAADYRAQLESLEKEALGNPAKTNTAIWFSNANFVLPFVDEISRQKNVLEPVKTILGPDILVWNASFFTKEPGTPDFVSWHQDLRYWGLSDAEEVTAWIALSDATVQSGCMRFIPGSHRSDLLDHHDSFATTNMLSRGQELAVEVDENNSVDTELQSGQMSLHHGNLFHASHPNQSSERRIGLAIRYITPSMHQRDHARPYAHLVAGEDNFGNFRLLPAPDSVMSDSDVAIAIENIAIGEKFFYENAEGQGRKLR
jgi:hypothetical protein